MVFRKDETVEGVDGMQATTFGVLDPPLGNGRLKAVEMVAALARLGAAAAEAALTTAGLVPRCMDLFLQYPFNNMLHHQARRSLPKPGFGGGRGPVL